MAVPRSSTKVDGDPTSPTRNSLASSLRSSLQHKLDDAQVPPVHKIPLWELNCGFGIVKRKYATTVSLKDAIKHQRKTQQADVIMLKVALAATVKETGVDDQGLLEFYNDYFHGYPIYMDEKWQLYKAMHGGRKLGIFTIVKAILGARKRLQRKNIKSSTNNHKSEGWMAGGVMVFDKRGELVFVLPEEVGKPFDAEQLKLAIAQARRSNEEALKPKALEQEARLEEESSGSGDSTI